MSDGVGMELVKRFVRLPDSKKTQYFQALKAEGISFEALPIPALKEGFSHVPLSYAQERQWVVWQQDPDSVAYNLCTALRLRGPLDVAALEHSFNDLIQRHEALRTNFMQGTEGTQQVVHERRLLTIRCETLSQDAISCAQSKEGIRNLLEGRRQEPFNLEVDLLMRVDCVVLGANDHILLLTQHHIVSDRVSMQLISEELMTLYAARVQQQEAVLPALPIQYADYSIWQRSWLEAGGKEVQLSYWKDHLNGIPSILELPLDHPRPAIKSYQGERVDITISRDLSERIKRLAQDRQVTPFMLLLASLQVLLYRYTGQRDICIGVPNAGRGRVEIQRLIGFFVNTHVLKGTLSGDLDFNAVVHQVKAHSLDAQTHQDLPFEQLVDALQPERSLAHSPLFQVVYDHTSKAVSPVCVRGSSVQEADVESSFQVEELAWEQKASRFDLTFKTYEYDDDIGGHIVYATDLFERATIERMAVHWVTLLSAAVAEPERRISDLPMVEAATEAYAPDTGMPMCAVHEQIERHAKQQPDAMAVVSGQCRLTYGELNQQAHELAKRLIYYGLRPDRPVGLMMPRCVDAVVGMLAVLKAGGCYVPVEPSCPAQRLEYIVENSGVDLLLVVEQKEVERLNVSGVRALSIESIRAFTEAPVAYDLPETVFPQQSAYVIYTSGSTGQPKGVAVSHEALASYMSGIQERGLLTGLRSVAWVSTLAADLGHTVLFGALYSGITLHVIDADMAMDGKLLGEYLHRHDIDAMKIVPSHLNALMQGDEHGWVVPKRALILGGDVASPELISAIFKVAPSCQLFNHYGPTETTIGVLATPLSIDDTVQKIPLGRPLSNARVHILDPALQPAAAAGELYIGGRCLARGYVGKPGLTAERFVPDAFGPVEGGRLYRTGDQVRQGKNGLIDFIGRMDHQVKIRGFRVEIGEVETYLKTLHQVLEAAVVVQQAASGPRLLGYIVSSQDAQENTLRERIKTALKADLPDYMAPAQWVFCPSLPLTENGKIDRQALLKQAPLADAVMADVEEDASPFEQTIIDVWKVILERDHIGVRDNFFELGGDSILAIKMVGALRKSLQVKLNFKDVLRYQTLAELAAFVGNTVSAKAPDLTSLVSIGGGSQALPKLFCVHPAGGNVYCYQPLAIALKDVVQVYGVSYVAGGVNDRGMTWARLVSGYVKDIVEAQSEGPYHLLGYSLGGTLALDIAHALEARGKTVAFLGLIDTKLPADIEVLSVDTSAAEAGTLQRPSVDELTKVIEYFCVLYPDKADEVERLVKQSPALDYDGFVQWAAGLVGVSNVQFEQFFKDAVVENEVVEGFNTLARLNGLFTSFVVKPVSVRPSLWWSSILRDDRLIDTVESRLRSHVFTHGLKDSFRVEERHSAMIVNRSVMASIVAALSAR